MDNYKRTPEWAEKTIAAVEDKIAGSVSIKWNMVWEGKRFKLWANFEDR